MQEKLPVRKGVYILPNLFTTASLFTGFMALIWASQGNFEWSAMGILFSALMDGLDGKVARLTKTSSEFGVQYDSLADLAAFGVAPGFMVYAWLLNEYGNIGTTAAFLFATCSALRLARFNVASAAGASKKFFTGLPTPAAGCTLAALVFFQPYLPNFMQGIVSPFCLLLTVTLAVLMVSRVRYYSFKEFGFLTAHRFRSMLIAILLFTLIIMAPKVLGFLIFFGYMVAGLIYTFILLPRRAHLPLNKMMP
ncbi:CDP-diacylglycerol--serine O-phosphatidyltransferase [Desulfovibrio sp. OttesenSCG-928-O18]|nr:CDP-diacylglycerol--serine O-phosphatidyltransferase [Desulfovibrio sp. OttesenSCG-928-O18]